MSKPFSDAPLKIDGVTVKPRWSWSEGYRKEAREAIRATLSVPPVPDAERIDQYVAWYAEQHGITKRQAKRKLQRAGRIG